MAKSSNPRPQGRGVTIWIGLRTRVRFRVPPPLSKKPTTLGWFFFARFPQCWRGFGPRCDGRRCPGHPGSGPFSVLSSRPFSVSAKDDFAPEPAMMRVSGSLFVLNVAVHWRPGGNSKVFNSCTGCSALLIFILRSQISGPILLECLIKLCVWDQFPLSYFFNKESVSI
jgi:hypothetical protein